MSGNSLCKTSEEITIQVNELVHLFNDSESIETDF